MQPLDVLVNNTKHKKKVFTNGDEVQRIEGEDVQKTELDVSKMLVVTKENYERNCTLQKKTKTKENMLFPEDKSWNLYYIIDDFSMKQRVLIRSYIFGAH